ncbi:MAG: type II secretion system F family protein [Candidatus Omnitrophica bacterium]|jgi:type IV pilus assembly protein PilC|nr:type II secretion system F family protein [Candidatus Omnitrophota bacterium]
MLTFSYTVKNKEGKTVKGFVDAESKEKLVEYLQKEGYMIFSVSEAKKRSKGGAKGGVKSDDLVVFSRQFTTLIESSIPVVECLEILRSQVEGNTFKEALGFILKDVKEGASLSSAFGKHPRIFPEIYISMVEAGEVSGNLPSILDRVSVYLEKSSALKKKIISAMYYPIVVVLMAIGITTFLMIRVIPTFKGIFDSLNAKLPLPTQILINVSTFLSKKENMIVILIFLGISIFLFLKYINTDKGKKNYHKMLLKLPVLGDLIKKIAIARFARTFSTLIKSGVPIIKCLEIVGKTSGNKIIEEAVMKSKKFIQEGQTISAPLEETGIFPPMVVRMISIGERSGRLEEMLSKVAQFYEEQTDAMVAGLSSLIEPLIIVFLGIVVGGIVISLFLPIIQITQHLTK